MEKMVSANAQESKSPDYLKYSNGAARKTTEYSLSQQSTKSKSEFSNQEVIYQLYKKLRKTYLKSRLNLCQLNS